MAHDLLKNGRGEFLFFRNWKFNDFSVSDITIYEKFKSLLKLPKPPNRQINTIPSDENNIQENEIFSSDDSMPELE